MSRILPNVAIVSQINHDNSGSVARHLRLPAGDATGRRRGHGWGGKRRPDHRRALKARINGEKVHDVGYRVFLLDLALELGIERFAAKSRIDGGLEVVSVMAEGDDDQIAALRELVASIRPGDARVSDAPIEEYDGRIVSTTDYSQSLMVQIVSDGLLTLQRIERHKATMS